jgi:hypothetical protein
MPILTPAEALAVNKLSPLEFKIKMGDRLRAAESLQMAGRPASGHLRFTVAGTDTDTVTVTVGSVVVGGLTVPGSTVVYEMDNNAAVTAGRVLVTIGGTAALSATALAAAIARNQGASITAAAHTTDTTVIDVAHRVAGGTLTLASTSGGRIVPQNNGGQLAPTAIAMWARRRTVTAEDVTRARIRIVTGLATIDGYTFRFVLSAADNTTDNYNGTPVVTGGILEFPQGTAAGVFAANNVLELTIFGTLP